MSNNISNKQKTIYSIYGIIALCLITANVVIICLSQSDNSEAVLKKTDRPPPPVGRSVDRSKEDQKYEQAYDKRNAEITPWAEDSTPLNTGNAALLYYQAFLIRPEINDVISHNFYLGNEPDRKFRAYLGRCLPLIEIVEIASRMPNCTWGIWSKHQISYTALRREIGRVSNILLMDARTLAVDGHYRVALERCLTVQRVTLHLNEEPKAFTFNIYIWSLETIKELFGVIPPNVSILTWFRDQLGEAKMLIPDFTKFLIQTHIESILKDVRVRPVYLVTLRKILLKQSNDEQPKKNTHNLTDEQLLLHIDKTLKSLIDPFYAVLDSDKSHKQKLNQMQQLISDLKDTDPLNKLVLIDIANMEDLINIWYKSYVWHLAHTNCIKVAVEVYLVVAKTGRLPEKLPEHLPKDPTIGWDFVYEITNEGFALRCGDEEFLGDNSRRLEFEVKK